MRFSRTTSFPFVLSIAMVVYAATSVKACRAWSPDANRKDSSEGRRNAVVRLLGIPAAVSIAGGSTLPAVASARPTANDLRRIYDAGATGYESVYTESIVSKALDFSSLRTNLLRRASGDVLELGVGTGLNLPHFPTTTEANLTISSYTGMDLSTKMMELAQGRFARGEVSPSLEALYKDHNVRFEVGDVNNLEGVFGGAQKFDTVVDTFSLCVFPEPSRALEQAKLVLKQEGRLLLLEHQDSLVSKMLSPTRSITDVSGTCRYDDNVLALVRNAGFTITSLKSLAGGFLVEVVATKN